VAHARYHRGEQLLVVRCLGKSMKKVERGREFVRLEQRVDLFQ
jgi:hypothetical protein